MQRIAGAGQGVGAGLGGPPAGRRQESSAGVLWHMQLTCGATHRVAAGQPQRWRRWASAAFTAQASLLHTLLPAAPGPHLEAGGAAASFTA